MSRAFYVDVVMYPCHSRSVFADVGNLRDGVEMSSFAVGIRGAMKSEYGHLLLGS